MGSAANAEIGGTYYNVEEAIPIQTFIIKLNHPQPATSIKFDNSTFMGFTNKKINQKLSKSIYMIFYWLQNRTEQGNFQIYWRPRKGNLRYYHTKHFATSQHAIMLAICLYKKDR